MSRPRFYLRSDVPLPEAYRKRYKYPFLDMRPGDSFRVALRGEDYDVVAARMRSIASNTGKKLNQRFIVRQAKDGVRVWRKE